MAAVGEIDVFRDINGQWRAVYVDDTGWSTEACGDERGSALIELGRKIERVLAARRVAQDNGIGRWEDGAFRLRERAED
jgi:hypothetical protein